MLVTYDNEVAHTIQLSINVGLQIPEIAELLTRCRRLLKHFSHSVQATETLLAQQKLILDRNARKDKPLYLITYTPTRWNSTLHDAGKNATRYTRLLTSPAKFIICQKKNCTLKNGIK